MGFATILVPTAHNRNWRRKWRDVKHAHGALAATYSGNSLNDDEFVRQVETFFKTCRELVDWIAEPDRGKPIAAAAKKWGGPDGFSGPSFKLCDAAAQSAKHHTRMQPGKDPVTAAVVEIGDAGGIHASIAWSRQSGGAGYIDALKLADRCIAEWERFFRLHGLNPEAT